MVVNASANRVPTCVVVHAVQADAEVVAPAAVAARYVCVEVFSLSRPVWHEHPLNAAACCPARLRCRVLVAAVTLNVRISETARAVNEKRWHNRQAKTTANRAKPWQAYAAANPTWNVTGRAVVHVEQVAVARSAA